MGIDDRDYMRDGEGRSDSPSSGVIAAWALIGAGSAFLVFYGLRLPIPIYLKIPFLIGIAFLLWRIWSLPRRIEGAKHLRLGLAEEGKGEYTRAVYHYEKAASRLPNDPYIPVRLLAAYDSSKRINRAKDLIQTLDGQTFPKEVSEELEFLIAKYRHASFRDIGKGTRMTLGKN